jgi:hypothetical protein
MVLLNGQCTPQKSTQNSNTFCLRIELAVSSSENTLEDESKVLLQFESILKYTSDKLDTKDSSGLMIDRGVMDVI